MGKCYCVIPCQITQWVTPHTIRFQLNVVHRFKNKKTRFPVSSQLDLCILCLNVILVNTYIIVWWSSMVLLRVVYTHLNVVLMFSDVLLLGET